MDQCGHVTLPDIRSPQNGQEVRAPGLGFQYAQEGGPTAGAARLGQSTQPLLAELGLQPF